MVSLTVPSASCDRKHVIAICVKTNTPLKCPMCQLYTSYEPNAINNVTRNTDIQTFTLLAYAPEQICLPHHTYVPLYYYCGLHIGTHIIAHTSKQNNYLQQVFHTLLLNMCQKHASHMQHI